MGRSVSVRLLLDAIQYKREAKDVKGSNKDLVAGLVEAAKAGDDTATATDAVTQAMRRQTTAAKKLDGDIDGLRGSLKELATSFSEAQNEADKLDISKKIRGQQSELRKALTARKLLGDDNDTVKEGVRFGGRLAEGIASGLSMAGGPITRALSNVFGVLPPQAQVAIGAGVAAAIAATAPLIGAALAGAIVGGAGIGGVVGGFAIAARHPDVKAAATLTGKTFAETMERSAVSFVPATVDALGDVRAAIRSMEGDFEDIFSNASQFVKPLTEGLLGAVRAFLPGLKEAVAQAGPVIDVVAAGLERLGDATGDLFSTMADHAHEGANGLAVLFLVLEAGIRTIDVTIGALTTLYGWMAQLGMILNKDFAGLAAWNAEQERAKAGSSGFSQDLQGLINGFGGVTSTAATATAQLETFNELVKRLAGENLTARGAVRSMEEAIDAATASFKENGKTLDENTPKGRANAEALDRIAREANAVYAAVLEQTGSQEQASAAAARGRAKFIELATAMTGSKTEAKRLADMLFGIPSPKPKVDLAIETAKRNALVIQGKINAIHGKTVDVTVNLRAGQRSGVGGLGGLPFRYGGVVEHAQSGLINLRQAGTFSPQSPARYAFAESATGGEAFIPRRGDMDRSRAIWNYVGQNWLGMGGGTQKVVHEHRHLISFTDVLKGLQKEIRTAGGVAEVFK